MDTGPLDGAASDTSSSLSRYSGSSSVESSDSNDLEWLGRSFAGRSKASWLPLLCMYTEIGQNCPHLLFEWAWGSPRLTIISTIYQQKVTEVVEEAVLLPDGNGCRQQLHPVL